MERKPAGVYDEKTRKSICASLVSSLRKYGFEGPIHYTDFDNLESILRCGYLKSRNYQVEEGTSWIDSADQEAIAKTFSEVKNYVRFFYFYKTPTVYRFEQTSAARNSEQVALVFKDNIMADMGTKFTERIAAGYHGELHENPAEALLFPWTTIAERGPLPSKYYSFEIYNYKLKHRQAEFMYPQKVSLEGLEAIYFKSPEALAEAKRRFGNNSKFRLDAEHKRFNYEIVREGAKLCA